MTVDFLIGPGTVILLVLSFAVYLLSAVVRERSGPEPRVLTLVTSRPGLTTVLGAVFVATLLLVLLRLGVMS
jgi:hypothetical protein